MVLRIDPKVDDVFQRDFGDPNSNLLPWEFRSRIMYYWAGLYRQQFHERESYGALRPVITKWRHADEQEAEVGPF